ncbi:MAG: DUF4157 domain-containing protein [Bacteroidota bacterium]
MSANAGKTQESKSETVVNNVPALPSSPASVFGFVNNSPNIHQLNSYQLMANNAPQTRQAAQLQQMADNASFKQGIIQRKENKTGLPDGLKTGMENLSGISLDDIQVHRNSEKPTQLRAHAYAQGTEIHLGPGQEKHLAHEAWHVVQQKQGRVKPTVQLKAGIQVNDDAGLEREADVMGAKALSITGADQSTAAKQLSSSSGTADLRQYKISMNQSDLVIQKHDQHNDQRLETARGSANDFVDESIAGEIADMEDGAAKENYIKKAHEMQLDHGVSQENLGALDDSLTAIGLLVNPAATKYAKLKAAYQALLARIDGFPEKDDHATVGGFLLNIRKNLTPGFRNSIGNPGSTFDPDVREAGGTVSLAANTPALLNIDNQLRFVVRLVPKLPTQHQGTQVAHFNPRLEDAITAAITSMTNSLHSVNTTGAAPAFDRDLWYRFKGKWVKKAPAEYLDAVPAPLEDAAEKALWRIPQLNVSFYWPITVDRFNIRTDNREADASGAALSQNIIYGSSFNIQVSVDIPHTTWKHIYERHTLEQFAGDIQAVNTFWKEPPINKVDMNLLKPEVSLLIDRFVDIHSLGDIDDGETWQINGVANKLFFQGKIDLDKEVAARPKLKVELTSIAPQSPDLAVAILPAILQAHLDG